MLNQWPLKCIKSFGANQDLLVLDTSDSHEAAKSYFCVNTPQAEEILRIFREATGIMSYSGATTGPTGYAKSIGMLLDRWCKWHKWQSHINMEIYMIKFVVINLIILQ